ncbi:hypothetical protein [Deinococcus yavapaiensis]|uniref:Sensory transduction regulator n=1 Tax=Deinococcus yavapaiensis KR-236 TaxID=694435 RepID=A0A318S4J4_9DEIO|nr:hypothetical protein [Deinococcus yavapaiensis]PYE53356.1 hypothetical protein DES52_109130 [Deinococcus yavapaiensis KR-236]
MNKHLARIADFLATLGCRADLTDQNDALLVQYPLEHPGQTLPFFLEVDEVAVDQFALHVEVTFPQPLPPGRDDLNVYALTYANLANREMELARCFVVPDYGDQALPEDDEVDPGSLPSPLEFELTVEANFFLAGLKQTHFKLMSLHLEAFVDDALLASANFADIFETDEDGPEDSSDREE